MSDARRATDDAEPPTRCPGGVVTEFLDELAEPAPERRRWTFEREPPGRGNESEALDMEKRTGLQGSVLAKRTREP